MGNREDVLDFIQSIARADADLEGLDDKANLVDAGVIDSLSVVQIVIHLETMYRKDVSAADLATLVSIQGILDVIHS
jgi:acyl carrier protein